MNFEIIDNLFQVTVLACAVLVAVVHLFRHKDRLKSMIPNDLPEDIRELYILAHS